MNACENDITFSLVVPVRNEADKLDDLCRALMTEVDKLGQSAEIIFVNDGSTDDTDRVLHRLQIDNDCVRVVELSRPFGRAAAVTAGIEMASGQAVITFDRRCENWAELQAKLIANWREGFEIIHAVGKGSEQQPVKTRKCLAALAILGRTEPTQRSIADMRLIDHKAVSALRTPGSPGVTVDERVMELGFRQTTITHDAAVQDEPHIPAEPKRSCAPSARPFCMLLAGGGLLLCAATVCAVASFIAALLGAGPGGWAWLVIALVTLAGLQMVSLVLVGRYILQDAGATERHPLYVVRDKSGFDRQESDQPVDESGRSGYVVYT